MVDDAADRVSRSRLLPAQVEILLAAGDVEAAGAAAGELARLADELGAPFLTAVAAHANGAVLLAQGDPRAALGALRRAWTGLAGAGGAVRGGDGSGLLLGLACRELGDRDGAELELDGRPPGSSASWRRRPTWPGWRRCPAGRPPGRAG